jgi:hypothetical protein
MLIDIPVVLPNEPAEVAVESMPVTSEWAEAALTVMFAAAAVLFVSFLAVVTGLV